MEQVHLRVLVQALEEVLEWVDHEGEERVAPEQVQAQQGSVFVPNAELSHLMRLEFPVTKRIVLNVGQRW
jgi:hypothetical protein